MFVHRRGSFPLAFEGLIGSLLATLGVELDISPICSDVLQIFVLIYKTILSNLILIQKTPSLHQY